MLKQAGTASKIKQNIARFMNKVLNRNCKRNLGQFHPHVLTFQNYCCEKLEGM